MIISYDRKAAVQYAAKWALGRNPMYYDYSKIGGDCTNFASQCLYSGSGIMDYTETVGWYYIDANQKAPAWTGVEQLYQYLMKRNRPGPFAEEVGREEVKPGDLIQLSFNGEIFGHTPVVLAVRPAIFVAAHSEDSFMRPLQTYDYKKIRFLHILGVEAR